MSDPALDPYPPLNVLKPLTDDLWIVDGPVVRMRYIVGSIPFSTRMTVVRLPDGRLWLHSPTELTEELQQELAQLGRVTWLVAPNRLHWIHLAAWQRAYPQAETHVAPGVDAKAVSASTPRWRTGRRRPGRRRLTSASCPVAS